MVETPTDSSASPHKKTPRPPLTLLVILIFLLSPIDIPAVIAIGNHYYPGLVESLLASYTSALVLLFAIALLRRVRAGEVYLLWFVFFFMTSVTFGIYYYLDSKGLIDWHDFDPFTIQQSRNEGTPEHLIRLFIGLFTSLKDEITFIVVVIAVVVVPQILAYGVSGAFGCAKPPILVSYVTYYSIVSLIKFFCGLAAFQMSAGLFKLYSFWKQSVAPSLHDFDIISRPAMILSAAFLLAAIYYWLSERAEALIKNDWINDWIERRKKWMTRSTDTEGGDGGSVFGRVATKAVRAAAVEAARATAAEIARVLR